MTDKITTPAAPTVTEFAATLLDLDKGRVHDDMGAGLAEVVAAVRKTGGQKGKLTLILTVEPLDPESFEEEPVLKVTGEVKVDAPRPKRAATVFFATGTKGQITRDAPRRDDDPRRDA